jgi:uncharacterized protein YajQ (UPF0234 family)
VKNEVLQRVTEKWNILQTVKSRKANWIGHILCRDCLPKQVIERKKEARIKVTGRQEEDVQSYWMMIKKR